MRPVVLRQPVRYGVACRASAPEQSSTVWRSSIVHCAMDMLPSDARGRRIDP